MTGRTIITAAALLLLSPSLLHSPGPASAAVIEQTAKYVCPMHAEVAASSPGVCPKCGMQLREASKPAQTPAADVEMDEGPAIEIPDVTVYDQRGKRLSFYTDLVKGKTVAINFIFTTCTTICPPLAAVFRGVQKELGDRVGGDVTLISVSVDPVTDTPDRLNAFAAKFNAGPGWTFITGAKPAMDRLLRALGAYVSDKNDHTPMVLVINDPAAYRTRTYGLAPPWKLAEIIKAAQAEGSRKSEAKEREQ